MTAAREPQPGACDAIPRANGRKREAVTRRGTAGSGLSRARAEPVELAQLVTVM